MTLQLSPLSAFWLASWGGFGEFEFHSIQMKIDLNILSRSAPGFIHLKLDEINGLLTTVYVCLISLEHVHLNLPHLNA